MTYPPKEAYEEDQKEYMTGLLVSSISIFLVILINPALGLLLAGIIATGSGIYLLARYIRKTIEDEIRSESNYTSRMPRRNPKKR
jgi:hypothetical protein